MTSRGERARRSIGPSASSMPPRSRAASAGDLPPLPRRSAARASASPSRGLQALLGRGRKVSLLTLGGGAAILLVLLLALSRLAVGAHVYPGVQALGAPLGGLTRAEARETLLGRAQPFGETAVSFSVNGVALRSTLAQLGVGADVDAQVEQAMGVGRSGMGVSGMLRSLRIADGAATAAPALAIDHARFGAALQSLLSQAGLAPVDAQLGTSGGTVAVVPEHDGVFVDQAAAERALGDALRIGSVDPIPLEAQALAPRIHAADLAGIASSVQTYLADPVVFVHGGTSWTVQPQTVASAVRVRENPGSGVSAVFAPEMVDALVAQFRGALGAPAVDPAIGAGGQFGRLVGAADGVAVNRDALTAAIAEALASGSHRIEIPVSQQSPSATTDQFLATIGVTTLIATGASDFSGSEKGRATNIRVASALIDGLMIPPGKTFSYNHGIGSIVDVPGFVPAGATENGIPGTSVGGGVCQVSTTIFRAALKAGFPVTEWWPHAYRSVYYEQSGWAPGFDASIQQPEGDPFGGSDLAFTNTTDAWMLIRTQISADDKLTVQLFGKATGYRVEIDNPQQSSLDPVTEPPTEEIDPSLPPGTVKRVQPTRDGMTVTVVRHVFDASGAQISTDRFVTTYLPQSEVYRVSPDRAGSMSGA